MGRRSGFRRRTCRGCNRMRRRRGGGMWRRIRSSGLLRRHNRDRLRRGRRWGIQRLGWGSAIYCGVFLAGVGCLAVRPHRGGGGLAGRSLFLERTYAGRRSRARQRGARLRDTLAVRPRRDGELPAGPCFSSAPTPAGAAVPGSVGPGSATLLRSAPAGTVESLPAGSCFSSAPEPAGAVVPGSVAPGSATPLRSAPAGAVESLPAGSCFSSTPMPAGAVVPGSVVPGSLAATTPLPVNSPGLEVAAIAGRP